MAFQPAGSRAIAKFLSLIVLGLIAIVGILWWSTMRSDESRQAERPSRTKAVTNFEECRRAPGSKIMQTFPEQCVTKDGKQFVANAERTAIDVPEWRIRVQQPEGIGDAYYKMLDEHRLLVSTRSLDQIRAGTSGCTSGLEDIVIERAKPGDTRDGQMLNEEFLQERGKKLGDYYYYRPDVVSAACMPEETDQYRQARDIQQRLAAVLPSAEAY